MRRFRSRSQRRSRLEIAAEKAFRASQAFTCQICARDILASKGVIAHHGYERPWHSHLQTASCGGARALPFECSNHELLKDSRQTSAAVVSQRRIVRALQRKDATISCEYQDRTKPADARGRYPSVRVSFTALTFAETVAAHRQMVRWCSPGDITFERFQSIEVAAAKQLLRMIEGHLTRQQRRNANWKQTHAAVWADGKFVRFDKL